MTLLFVVRKVCGLGAVFFSALALSGADVAEITIPSSRDGTAQAAIFYVPPDAEPTAGGAPGPSCRTVAIRRSFTGRRVRCG